MDDEAIRTLVTRLSRHHPSGGRVIERAAILAEGEDSGEVLAWIAARGEPEAAAAGPEAGGLHSARMHDRGGPAAPAPLRYVLPPGTL
jgi:hypothetical protein